MAAAPVAELEGVLNSMLSLKAPGVTGGKISAITTLCNANIQSETVLIQRIYTHFKKAPPTHKLGVLYVVDSVTRGWVEQARKTGQPLGPNENPVDGTFAAGHKRVTEMLPSLMNDIINSAPDDQKEKINKLVDIWDRSGTFQSELLSSFRQKLAAPRSKGTTTPPGSPPKDFISLNDNAGNSAQAQDTSSILQALANMAKTNANTTAQPGQGPGNSFAGSQQAVYGQNMPPAVNQNTPMPPVPQAVNPFGAANGGNNANPLGALGNAMSQFGAPPQPQSSTIPQAPPAAPTAEQLQQQVQIIQMLQQQGIPPDQWAVVLQALMSAGAGGMPPAAPPLLPPQQPNFQNAQNQNQFGGQNDSSRDRTQGYGMRSPPQGRYRRSRSRSPPGYDRRRGDESPHLRRRDSPVYGTYGRSDDQSKRDGYRQRSPDRDRRRRSVTPPGRKHDLPPPGPKVINWDNSIPREHIKVLSRTLFVGGVTSGEDTLRKIFEPYGIVQTCIVNVDKRHAFVKMVSRRDALAAKEGMERYRGQDMQLRTRWGVGFGPRDCSDYQTGISVIPIGKLTDADRKWMLTAEYGGTGGKPIEGGMVVEEPDIEIGAGVSSKAISRRMQTDRSGQHGPRSNRDNGDPHEDQGRDRRQDDRSQNNNQRNGNNEGSGQGNTNFGSNPPFPGGANFPPFPFPNGFPFPPGFMFPPGAGAAPGQPPPPGAS